MAPVAELDAREIDIDDPKQNTSQKVKTSDQTMAQTSNDSLRVAPIHALYAI